MRTIDQMVQQEVLCCMSGIVATLANAYGAHEDQAIIEQAFELALPVGDYEEAARQAGWTGPAPDRGWQAFCIMNDIDPYEWQVFEHWAVSDWFAAKLIEAGEKVDKDFAGLCVWARTTTGQSITMDGVIKRIYAETHKED